MSERRLPLFGRRRLLRPPVLHCGLDGILGEHAVAEGEVGSVKSLSWRTQRGERGGGRVPGGGGCGGAVRRSRQRLAASSAQEAAMVLLLGVLRGKCKRAVLLLTSGARSSVVSCSDHTPAVQLHRRQLQVSGDVCVLDVHDLVHVLPLDPLRGHRAAFTHNNTSAHYPTSAASRWSHLAAIAEPQPKVLNLDSTTLPSLSIWICGPRERSLAADCSTRRGTSDSPAAS
jgi:hypothetical protein